MKHYVLAGIDPAWKKEGNHSAIAFGVLKEGTIEIVRIVDQIFSAEQITSILSETDDLNGVAVDASLLIKNDTGMRPCEKDLGRVFGRMKAGCYPTNLKRHKDSTGVHIEKYLGERGFKHRNSDGNFMIECYPHASLIKIFGLSERLAYKKGNKAARIAGQQKLAEMILSLRVANVMELRIPERYEHHFSKDFIQSLTLRTLKENEDVLDSIVCLYVAALFKTKEESITFPEPNKMNPKPNFEEGYIWVPNVKCSDYLS